MLKVNSFKNVTRLERKKKERKLKCLQKKGRKRSKITIIEERQKTTIFKKKILKIIMFK